MLALGIVLVARSAGAAPPPAAPAFPVHLRYSAPRTCPSEADFVAALRRDTVPFELTSEGEARRVIDVDLEVLAGSARGHFRLLDRGPGTTIQRELTGPDCEAVARALALMLALTMQGLSEPEPSVEPAPPPPPSPPPRAPEAQPRETPRPAPSPPPQLPSSRRLRFSVDVQGGLTGAVVNDALPFARVGLEVEPVGWRFHPALAVSIRQSLPKEIPVAGGEAAFLWTAGALRLCPHVIAIGSFDLAPCVEAALGRLRADANGLPGARSSTDLWAEGALLVAARWHLSPRWYLTTMASVTVAFTRSRFELSSGALISETPAVGIGGSLGVGLAF